MNFPVLLLIALSSMVGNLVCVYGWTSPSWRSKNSRTTRLQFTPSSANGALFPSLLSIPQRSDLFTPAPGSLDGKTIVITGGTTGMGFESVKRLAKGGAKIVFTARSTEKGEKAMKDINNYLQKEGIQDVEISFEVLELDRFDSVRQAAEKLRQLGQIDVLLNNAGVMAIPERTITVDGFEKQIQTNHLGHFLLTGLLVPVLSRDARIITVASSAHLFASVDGGLNFDYVWKAEDQYHPWRSYAQSKLANMLFTQELQRKSNDVGLNWTVACLHPGVVSSDLFRYSFGQDLEDPNNTANGLIQAAYAAAKRLGKLILTSVEEGATTQIWLVAGAPGGGDVRAKYFEKCEPQELSRFATDEVAAKRLWEESEKLTDYSFTMQVLRRIVTKKTPVAA